MSKKAYGSASVLEIRPDGDVKLDGEFVGTFYPALTLPLSINSAVGSWIESAAIDELKRSMKEQIG